MQFCKRWHKIVWHRECKPIIDTKNMLCQGTWSTYGGWLLPSCSSWKRWIIIRIIIRIIPYSFEGVQHFQPSLRWCRISQRHPDASSIHGNSIWLSRRNPCKWWLNMVKLMKNLRKCCLNPLNLHQWCLNPLNPYQWLMVKSMKSW